MKKDIVIVGGGPAGLTAAIYALRAGKSVVLFERKSYGGQISQSHLVENYPGFESIGGNELSMNLLNQVKALGGETIFGDVKKIIDGKEKTVITTAGEYECKAVILALGAEAKKIGAEGEDKFIGRGVSYCALCDGNFYRNKSVAVVGGGSTAVQDALYLSEICSEVHLIHRRDSFRAEKSLTDKLMNKKNIIFHKSCVLTKISGEKLIEEITLKSLLNDEEKNVAVKGVFVAVGQKPATDSFRDILPVDEYGYADVGESCEVKEGIYVCGDCRKKEVRQLTTATADGSVAAVRACEYCDKV